MRARHPQEFHVKTSRDDARVWIAQVMCRQRHTILAGAALAADRDAARFLVEPLRDGVRQMVREGSINPWCGICGEPIQDWFVDLGQTAFTSMEEAKPALERLRKENLQAMAVLGGHPGPGKAN